MKNISSILVLLILVHISYAQKKTFHTVLGSTGDDIATSADVTDDNGFIMAGIIKPYDSVDKTQALVVKLDELLKIQWQKTYDAQNSGYNYNTFGAVLQTKNGGYVLTGTSSVDARSAAFISIIKLNKDGNFQWSNFFKMGVPAASKLVLQTHDDGFVIAGNIKNSDTSGSDIFLAKFDKNGVLMWGKRVGSSLNAEDSIESMVQTQDSGLVITGNTYRGISKIFVLKLDKNGGILWLNTYEDESPVYTAVARTTVATKNNQIFISGSLFSEYFLGNTFVAMKLNQDGTLANGKLFGRSKQGIEPFKTKEDKFGNLVTMGRAWKTRDFENTQRPFFLKIDSTVNANIIYSKKHNSTELYSTLNIGKRKKSNYFVTGTTDKRSFGGNDFGLHTIFTNGTTGCITSKDLILETIPWNPKITASEKTQSDITTGSFALVEKVSTYAQVHILCATSNDTTAITFNARAISGSNMLQWVTDDEETNSKDFVIERSTDGIHFKQLAVMHSGNYNDVKPLAGINYYRISFTQADGSNGYSDIKSLIPNAEFSTAVITNPVTSGNLALSISNVKTAILQLTIMNTEGKIMVNQKINVTAGIQNKMLDISALAGGMYFIKLTTNTKQVTLKFVKQ
ncbi:MAG: T9SS type A sorting domain-containing protein [Panacibacter sp.]